MNYLRVTIWNYSYQDLQVWQTSNNNVETTLYVSESAIHSISYHTWSNKYVKTHSNAFKLI